jgi:hypothetical protein
VSCGPLPGETHWIGRRTQSACRISAGLARPSGSRPPVTWRISAGLDDSCRVGALAIRRVLSGLAGSQRASAHSARPAISARPRTSAGRTGLGGPGKPRWGPRTRRTRRNFSGLGTLVELRPLGEPERSGPANREPRGPASRNTSAGSPNPRTSAGSANPELQRVDDPAAKRTDGPQNLSGLGGPGVPGPGSARSCPRAGASRGGRSRPGPCSPFRGRRLRTARSPPG